MTIYEREGGYSIGPFQFGGSPGEEYDRKSLVIRREGEIWRWPQEWWGVNYYRAIMDVLGNEIAVSEYGIWGDNNDRVVANEAINRDPLTRRYFIFRP